MTPLLDKSCNDLLTKIVFIDNSLVQNAGLRSLDLHSLKFVNCKSIKVRFLL